MAIDSHQLIGIDDHVTNSALGNMSTVLKRTIFTYNLSSGCDEYEWVTNRGKFIRQQKIDLVKQQKIPATDPYPSTADIRHLRMQDDTRTVMKKLEKAAPENREQEDDRCGNGCTRVGMKKSEKKISKIVGGAKSTGRHFGKNGA